MKAILGVLLLAVSSSAALSQGNNTWQAFYPYHKGDVRQYRSIFTGEITHTQYTDSVIVDSLTKDRFIFGRNVSEGTWSTEDRIDSSGNLYNMRYQSAFVRYKLYADSGDSWIGGYSSDTTHPVRIGVIYTYDAFFAGMIKKVKVYSFEGHWNSDSWFWLGNDHLAEDIGLIKEEVEPSDTYELTGAIINGVTYGVIDAIHERAPLLQVPATFMLEQNYPNPFNPSTTITYSLPHRSHVSLSIFNTLGERVALLLDREVEAGFHEARFNA
ncbi:MAG: hypothetical protein IT282_09280, partial [Bacteroidetes bacterium]|nr:hypothetical protein [Bacteroidota bacterium]